MKFVDKLTFNNETYEIRDSAARDILTQQGENIAEIDGRQQVMRSEINSLQTRMGEAEQDILNNSASIADIEDTIDVMDNDIDSNTGRITALEARVDECEDINTAQQVEINNIKNRVTTAEGNINVINGNISDINTSLDAIAAVDTQQTAQINQNKTDITTLKNRANAADSRMDAMDTTIADLDDRIVASTYEAGEGIYFGQGEEHTNINVEDELLDEIHQNTQDVADLKDRVDNLEDRVDDVEDDIDDIKGDITTIQGDITSIQGDITSIQGDITTIQGDVSDMHTIVNNISNTVTNIQAEIAVHDEDINKLKESAKCNVITVEYAPVGGVWTYTAQDTAATILRYIEEYKAKSATAQSDYIDHKDIVVNVSQGPYSYPDMVGIINNYSKPLYIYETSVDYVVCFINNTNWRSGFDNDDYELVSLIITTGQTPTITFQTYNWDAKLQTLSQAVASMTAQVNANTNAINSIGNTLTTMQTNITSMQGDITTIQGNITNINSDITNINGDIATVRGDVTTAQGDITQLKSDMTTAQGDITGLQSDVVDIDKRTHVHKIPLVITSTGDPPTFTTPITTAQFNDIISDYNSNGGQIIAVITDGTSSSNPPYEGNCNLISIEGYNTGDVSGTVGNHYMIFETCDNDHYSQKYYITLFTRIGPSLPDVVNIDVKTVDPFADFVNVTSPTDLARLYNIVTNTDLSTMKQYTHIPLIYFNVGTIWQDTMGIIERDTTTVKITYKRGENISQYGLEEYTLYQITMTGASTYTTNTINLSNDTSAIKYYQELCGISRNVAGTTRDLNAIIEPGRWNVDTSASTTNNGFPSDVDPTQINHWTLENTSSVVTFGFISNYTVITQTLTIKDNPGVMYRRARNNNTWGPWYKFTGTVVT